MMPVIAEPGSKKDTRTTLKGLTRPQLQDWAASIGEPPYRGAQLFDWLFGLGLENRWLSRVNIALWQDGQRCI